MKALTIWQPWASLIIAGAKPYEFRGWKLPASMIGQRIVIHAAARKIDREEAHALYRILQHRERDDELRQAAAETCLIPGLAMPVLGRAWMPNREPLPMAAGLGTAVLGEPRLGTEVATAVLGEPRLGTEVATEFGVPRANDSDRDQHANWAWPLTDIDPWLTPIPMRGAQGFWNWPTPVDFVGGDHG